MTARELAEMIGEPRPSGTGWLTRCPAHDDHSPSLKIDEGDDGCVLVKCFAGCTFEDIIAAVGVTPADLFPAPNETGIGGGWGREYPSTNSATPQPERSGCTVAAYAAAKKLPIDKLVALGVTEITYNMQPAVRIPYYNVDGTVAAVRIRLALSKGDASRFAWKKGAKPCLYGLDRLGFARTCGQLTLVEGESDTHTLVCAGVPVLGLPGAGSFKEQWSSHFDGIDIIFVVIEPDQGGESVLDWLGRSAIRDRVRLVRLARFKDVSEMWIDDPAVFEERWAQATRCSEPWAVFAERAAREQANSAWTQCRALAEAPDILAQLDASLERRGVVGERRLARVIYLAMTSRTQDRPVSPVVTGPSSCGKSHVVQQVLEHFPPDAYYALTAMSERALAYSDESLEHRMLVLYETAGLSGEFASYLIRSLLSEGRVRYETVEKTKDGMRARLIDRPGPTGLITTTTAVHLHPENETRMLSIPATDTADQTRRVLLALSRDPRDRGDSDLAAWRALQTWLRSTDYRVVVPYAKKLAAAIPPVATRLRRDFTTLLTLIQSHALLHQATRERDQDGRIVATTADYEAIYHLVNDLFGVAVRATVSATIRETVAAVRDLTLPSKEPVSAAAVVKVLALDKGTVSRRLKVALTEGYLQNLETRKGQPMKLLVGEALPDAVALLPSPASLEGGCGVAVLLEGSSSPAPQQEEVPLDGRF